LGGGPIAALFEQAADAVENREGVDGCAGLRERGRGRRKTQQRGRGKAEPHSQTAGTPGVAAHRSPP
ncbi:MAG: hypothetical protein ACK4WH_05590, partial [Phycisphaerales bacterium]